MPSTRVHRTSSICICIYSFLICCLWIPFSTSLSTTSNANCNASKWADLGIDVAQLQDTIHQGRVFQVHDFFTEKEVISLLDDMDRLEADGTFQRSGLSNTVKGKEQNFGSQDRYTCVAWDQQIMLSSSPEENPNLPSHIIKLQQLKTLLATVLDRPSMLEHESSLANECYYSKSLPHSALSRHMDERHEECKQKQGWLLPSRRSISWLVYLSDDPWTLEDNGGGLRAFPQKRTSGKSTHEGNLQVGWLTSTGAAGTTDGLSKPVYLDSWFPLVAFEGAPPEPHCILYALNDDDEQTIHYLTHPWPSDVLGGMSTSEFILLHQDQYPDELFVDNSHENFHLIEDRAAWDAGKQPLHSEAVDYAPLRRSLVMFDSVSVPHEVSPIIQGTRRALAGWFHEETQQFPQEYYEV